MDDQSVKSVIKGIMDFAPVISLKAGVDPGAAYNKALEKEPALLYFVEYISTTSTSVKSELHLKYRYKDVKFSDIKKVATGKEFEDLLAETVEAYNKNLLVLAKNTVNIDGVYDLFMKRDSVFYPNFRSVNRSTLRCNDKYTLHIYNFKYRLGYVKLAQMEIDVDNEVERLCKQLFREGMPREAKIYLAHNYLATTVVYLDKDDNRLEKGYTQSAYGALIKKHCVCQGFAEAFKRIMDHEGIECIGIRGRIKEDNGRHAWNLVSPGQNCGFYHIDTTWDVNSRKPEYDYFCISDKALESNREWDRTHYPKCTGSYPIYSVAKRYITQYKANFLEKGIDPKILDV